MDLIVNWLQAHSTWRITHLLMPQQHGTSDSCDIANEEDVAEYQDEHDLITLGWIHVCTYLHISSYLRLDFCNFTIFISMHYYCCMDWMYMVIHDVC